MKAGKAAPRWGRRLTRGVLVGLLVLAAATTLLWAIANHERRQPVPLPGALASSAMRDSTFRPAPIAWEAVEHRGMAQSGLSSMHSDGYQSDVHAAAGPFEGVPEVRSRRAGNWLPRQCSTFVFRRDGKVFALCGGLTGFRIVLIDPETLEALASHDLPMRPSAFQAMVRRDMNIVFGDSSGGAYLFLDDHDRVVLIDSRQQLQRIAATEKGGQWTIGAERMWDLTSHVPNNCMNWDNWFPRGECDMATTVMPDGRGHYWWVTRYGRVGTLDPISGRVRQVRLAGEEIQNAIAVDRDAAYVVTDHHQYAFTVDGDGVPRVLWRYAYDRGSGRKVGTINAGSGTTPTLIGPDYLAIADNADPRINVVILRRGRLQPGQRREVCRVPAFAPGASATDNSLIGWGHSVLIENNAGYRNAYTQTRWDVIRGGVARIDIAPDESSCQTIWTSPLVVPSVVAKLSAANGIAYYYSFDGPAQRWSIVGLDSRTGRAVVKISTGRGRPWNNNWSSMAIAPNGDLYVGTTMGFLQVRMRRTGASSAGPL